MNTKPTKNPNDAPAKNYDDLTDTPPFTPSNKATFEIKNECNPDNGDFFEKYSNPLSSKGN